MLPGTPPLCFCICLPHLPTFPTLALSFLTSLPPLEYSSALELLSWISLQREGDRTPWWYTSWTKPIPFENIFFHDNNSELPSTHYVAGNKIKWVREWTLLHNFISSYFYYLPLQRWENKRTESKITLPQTHRVRQCDSMKIREHNSKRGHTIGVLWPNTHKSWRLLYSNDSGNLVQCLPGIGQN